MRVQNVNQTGASYALSPLEVLVAALIYVEYNPMYDKAQPAAAQI